ncbi:hypothetical protein GCM10009634_80200 [Saccharothrix xinjiangensis]
MSRQTISTITDKVVESMVEWQNQPLDLVYPVVFIDAIHVKIRDGQVANLPVYMAMAVTCEGHRDIVGLWAGDGGEGAKYWLPVLTELRNRGVADVLILVCDGLTGWPDAVTTVWPLTGRGGRVDVGPLLGPVDEADVGSGVRWAGAGVLSLVVRDQDCGKVKPAFKVLDDEGAARVRALGLSWSAAVRPRMKWRRSGRGADADGAAGRVA